ncbi:hypothetical protein SLE2022_009480 [Rubroshorea leprosula]
MLGVLIIAILSVFFVGFLFFLCGRKLFPLLKQKWSCKGSLKDEKLMLRRFQLVELERATKNFSKDCLLGSGAFGNVYRGTFEVEGTLAIKKAHAASFQSLQEFRNEVKLLSKVKHWNLVSLVGFVKRLESKGLEFWFMNM